MVMPSNEAGDAYQEAKLSIDYGDDAGNGPQYCRQSSRGFLRPVAMIFVPSDNFQIIVAHL